MGRKYYMGTTFVDCKKIVYENKVMENPKKLLDVHNTK